MSQLARVLFWLLVSLFCILLACMIWCIVHIGGFQQTLDTAVSIDSMRSLVSGYNARQQQTHVLMTSVFDSFFPATYGLLLFVLAVKSRVPAIVLVLPFVVVACDYTENLVQLRALQGDFDLAWLKSVATPGKFLGLFVCVAIIIAIRIRRKTACSE